MRFGIFDHLERRHDCDLAQQYEERLQLMAQADRAGVYSYHIAEHHHSPLCLAANQSVFLAAAAERTTDLKLGTLVYVLPLHHPIRILEEICMVDALSNGRVQVGVGRGAGGGFEIMSWGGAAADTEAMFRETLEILLLGFQNEFLTYQGETYRYRDLWMELRPVQRPHPAFWYAGNPVHAGALGMNFIGAGPIASTQRSVAAYLAAWKSGQQDPSPGTATLAEPIYGSMRHMFVADTDAEALDRARGAYEEYRKHYARPMPPTGPGRGQAGAGGPADDPAAAETEPATSERPRPRFTPASFTVDEAIAAELLLVGSPSTIRDYVRRYSVESGANYYVGAFSWGDLTHEESSKSLRLFADEVMPAIAPAGAKT